MFEFECNRGVSDPSSGSGGLVQLVGGRWRGRPPAAEVAPQEPFDDLAGDDPGGVLLESVGDELCAKHRPPLGRGEDEMVGRHVLCAD